MIYPFMTLNDETEITHTEMQNDGRVKVYMETPIYGGFKDAVCWLPEYKWENNGYSESELNYLKDIINSTSHLILEFAQTGGFDSASNF